MESKPVRAQALFAKQMGLYGLRFEYVALRVKDIYDNRDILVEELDLLERLKLSYMRRKLNAGLLLVPDGIEYAIGEEDPTFAETLVEYVTETIQFPDSLGTVVPIVVQGPAELLDQIRHIKFHDETMLDVEEIEKRIAKLKERIEKFDTLVESMVE